MCQIIIAVNCLDAGIQSLIVLTEGIIPVLPHLRMSPNLHKIPLPLNSLLRLALCYGVYICYLYICYYSLVNICGAHVFTIYVAQTKKSQISNKLVWEQYIYYYSLLNVELKLNSLQGGLKLFSLHILASISSLVVSFSCRYKTMVG